MNLIRRTRHFKLTAAFLLVALIGILIVSYLANQATAVGLRRFLDADAVAQWQAAGATDRLLRGAGELGRG